MKKIIILTGSARKNGNSSAMADSFEAAIKAKGMETVRIDTTKLQVKACTGCNTCYSTGRACTFTDDFNGISEELASADGIVIACPVYWYTFPAAIKAVLDKFYALYVGGHTFKGKKCALISCCEDANRETFDGINFAFDKSFELMEADIVGKVEIPGVSDAGDIKQTDGEEQAARLADLFE